MIWPTSVLNVLDGRYFVWISGENRSGKTLLALDLATYYLDVGFRLITNLKCVWNDLDTTLLELDSNDQLNAFVVMDEGGQSVRTKESIRLIMGYKGKLNAIFVMPSTEEPHEDLWRFSIEPASGFNKIIEFLFGTTILQNYFKVWRYNIFNPNPKRPDVTGYFVQLFAYKFHGIYSTKSPAIHPEHILSQFKKSSEDLYQAITGRNDFTVSDVATGRTGVEGSSFYAAQRTTKDARYQGRLSTVAKTRQK